MAHLEVKPRSRSTWWIWLIIFIIIVAAAYYYFYVYKGGSKPMVENHPYIPVATAAIRSIV
jgi:beta-lactam-binding protein with PASTA domain